MNISVQCLPENLPQILPEIIRTNIFYNLKNSESLILFNRNGHFKPKFYNFLTNITKFLMQAIESSV